MKLRSKKTGEVFDALIREKGGGGCYSLIVCDIKVYEKSKSTLDATHFILNEYESLAELNADWEDYVPPEPLIKDEKIRKAVRAWAEANNIRAVYYSPEEDGFYVKNFDDEIVASIYFGDKPMEEDGYGECYTIDELCGEEE